MLGRGRSRRASSALVTALAMILTFIGVALVVRLELVPGSAANPRALSAAPAVALASGRDRPAPVSSVVGVSLVAEVTGRSIAVYRRPDGLSLSRVLANPNPDGAQLVFLVKTQHGAWLQVYLPIRPNLSTGWIRSSQANLVSDPYRVRVNLRAHHLTVWRGERVILRAPVGVGRAVTPTPSGRYFITELLAQPDPHGIYGPYAFGLSAHSDVLHQFDGADGEIGLHGTNFAAGIGTDVSHGCIRISNTTITRLAHLLPLGTPVRITRQARQLS